MPFAVGERVGDYQVVRTLGAGGMGEVYQVRHLISERVEAMKVLLPNLESNAELADRFLREIKVQASLSHPNIAALYTAVKHGNQLLMLMEFVEGESIEQKLRGGPMTPEAGVRYMAQVLDALAYAHSRGVVHRDIKPANILVTPEGQVKLMDFGIARMKQDRKLTSTGQTLGSLFYMSPEQIRGEDLDARSDLYSTGVTLYEAVTGKRPFDGTSEYSVMAAHLQQTPVPPIQVDPRVPRRLNELILTAIAKERESRFQKAETFAAELRSCLTEAPAARPAAPAPPPPVPAAVPMAPPPAPAGPRWGMYAGIAGGVVLLVGLAASQIPRPQPVETPPAAAALAPVQAPAAALAVETPAPEPAVAQAPKPNAPAPVLRKQNLPDPVVATPAVSEPQQPAPQTPAVRTPVLPSDAELGRIEALRDRQMKLGVRLDVATSKMRSIEQQQAALGAGMRTDVKSGHALAIQAMEEAERRLDSGSAAGGKASLDRAEYLIEKLEGILGL